jgi:hypothetical protein
MYQENMPAIDTANRKSLAKRNFKETEQSRLQTLAIEPSFKAVLCTTHQTVGDLVEVAYNKNKHMKAQALTSDEPCLRKTVLQRALWESLRETFFAPDADTDALADAPVSISKQQASCYVKTKTAARTSRRRISSSVLQVAKQS